MFPNVKHLVWVDADLYYDEEDETDIVSARLEDLGQKLVTWKMSSISMKQARTFESQRRYLNLALLFVWSIFNLQDALVEAWKYYCQILKMHPILNGSHLKERQWI